MESDLDFLNKLNISPTAPQPAKPTPTNGTLSEPTSTNTSSTTTTDAAPEAADEEGAKEEEDDGEEGPELSPDEIATLLQQLEDAESAADGIESRLDGLLGNLDALLSALEGVPGIPDEESEAAAVEEGKEATEIALESEATPKVET